MNARGFAIGVDIGGTTTKAAVVDSDGGVSHLVSIPTCGDSPEAFSEKLRGTIGAVELRARAESVEPLGLGIAVAGFINGAHDRLAYNPNLAWLEGYPLRDAIARHFNLPVAVECDSNAAALAEHVFGVGRGAKRFLCIACGTGIGGGMVVDGEILRYAWECLGDVGHVIVEPDGAPCPCGGRGCIEALAGADAIAARWRRASDGPAHSTLRDVINAARAGDEAAREVLSDTGRLLGFALATLTNILSPDRIAIAGGLSEGSEFLLGPLERTLRSSASAFFAKRVTVLKAALGWQATLGGAACPFFRNGQKSLNGNN